MFESSIPTPYGVHCEGVDPECGALPCNEGKIIYLTQLGYNRQMSNPWATWKCPRCGAYAQWDDDNYEKFIDDSQKKE